MCRAIVNKRTFWREGLDSPCASKEDREAESKKRRESSVGCWPAQARPLDEPGLRPQRASSEDATAESTLLMASSQLGAVELLGAPG